MAHSQLEYRPWWRVDLVDIHCIWAVEILNRGNCKFMCVDLFVFMSGTCNFKSEYHLVNQRTSKKMLKTASIVIKVLLSTNTTLLKSCRYTNPDSLYNYKF